MHVYKYKLYLLEQHTVTANHLKFGQ